MGEGNWELGLEIVKGKNGALDFDLDGMEWNMDDGIDGIDGIGHWWQQKKERKKEREGGLIIGKTYQLYENLVYCLFPHKTAAANGMA